MSVQPIRKDNWSDDDDLILANSVLQHIREGSTQLKAFEEAANLLSRTASACGFRWNSTVRKNCEEDIRKAKGIRSSGSKEKVEISMSAAPAEERSDVVQVDQSIKQLDMIIDSANRYKITVTNMASEIARLRDELVTKDQEIERLNSILHNERPQEIVAEDYETFLKILNNARRLNTLNKL